MVLCPECGSSEVRPLRNARPERGAPDPGELAIYRCAEADCHREFIEIVPEPISDYAGDGVFAGNH